MYQDKPPLLTKIKEIFKDPMKASIGNNQFFLKNTAKKLKVVELEEAGFLATFGLEDIVSESPVHTYSV
jgi:hypothetical protein